MTLTLDEATEQKIQREVALGHYSGPAEVVKQAMALLDAQSAWLLQHREAIEARLNLSQAQAARGDVLTPEQTRELLATDRSARLDRTDPIR